MKYINKSRVVADREIHYGDSADFPEETFEQPFLEGFPVLEQVEDERLTTVLAGLMPDDLLILIYRACENVPFRVLAKSLGLKERTVKAKYYRALDKLRRACFEGRGDKDGF